jgi:hypothetical protein
MLSDLTERLRALFRHHAEDDMLGGPSVAIVNQAFATN